MYPGEGQMLYDNNDRENSTGCHRRPRSHLNMSSAFPKAQHVGNFTVSLIRGVSIHRDLNAFHTENDRFRRYTSRLPSSELSLAWRIDANSDTLSLI